jgi:predicted dehydrogenase
MAAAIRVGVVGTGGIARSQAKALLKLEHVSIVAGCDVREDALKDFAEEFEVQHTFADFNELAALDGMDAVTVCTPNFMHKDPTIAALAAGKHVLVEKPMAMNAQEAQAMVDAANASEATLTMGFQWRLGPAPQTLKRFIDAGQIGNALFARVQALRRKGIPSWGVFGQKHLQGGGPLIDIGVHLIEAAHYLMGEPRPVAASAQMFTYLGNKPPTTDTTWGDWDWETYTVEDLAVGLVRFENGAVMSVESSFVAHVKENHFGIQIMGDKGGCTVSPPVLFTDQAGTMVNVEPVVIGKWDTMERKIAEWIAFLRGEAETQCPAESGLMVQKILDGLYKSAEDGREIAIE